MRRLADDVWDDKHDWKAAEEDMETAPPAKRRPGNRYKNQVGCIEINKIQLSTIETTGNMIKQEI